MAGYSSTPLVKKLGIGAGASVYLDQPPSNYHELLEPLPPDVAFLARPTRTVDLIHVFAAERAVLARRLIRHRKLLKDDGVIWVSWPKKAAKVATDITEDVVRTLALPLGLVDVKVCAVDDIWSGLKLVIRKELRGSPALAGLH